MKKWCGDRICMDLLPPLRSARRHRSRATTDLIYVAAILLSSVARASHRSSIVLSPLQHRSPLPAVAACSLQLPPSSSSRCHRRCSQPPAADALPSSPHARSDPTRFGAAWSLWDKVLARHDGSVQWGGGSAGAVSGWYSSQ